MFKPALTAMEQAGRRGRRRRILYLMHVNWRWIKQRPQFLAEGLAANHDVRVLYPFAFRKRNRPADNKTSVLHSSLPPIPWKWASQSWARSVFRQWIARIASEFRADTIWLTHPSLVELLPERLVRLPVIYDCMDDALGFSSDPQENKRLVESESKLIGLSARIICSSENLRQVLVDRYGSGVRQKLSVVRNAISITIFAAGAGPADATPTTKISPTTKIAYIGTIAEWLDFDLLLKGLEANPGIEFHLVGPVLAPNAPAHDRLRYHGPVAHDRLREYVRQFDACMMPFRLSPLIEGVDPVKLYEYLAFGKEIISIRYPEIERFACFVNFYRTESEFMQLVGDLIERRMPAKNHRLAARAFLEQNTWRQRLEQVDELMQTLN